MDPPGDLFKDLGPFSMSMNVCRIFRLGTMCFSLPSIPSNQLISAQMESTCFKGILTCALFLKSRDFRDIKNYIRERCKKRKEKKLTSVSFAFANRGEN